MKNNHPDYMALRVDLEKKSLFLGVLLNILLPGAAHCYVGDWFFGFMFFCIIVGLTIFSLGVLSPILALLVLIEGYWVVYNYNKELIKNSLSKQD